MAPTITSNLRAQRKEERIFRQAVDAAQILIRALSAPDRSAQLAAASVLIETREKLITAIEATTRDEMDRVRHHDESPEAQAMPDLKWWYDRGIDEPRDGQPRRELEG